jgi:hypothetical protein
MRTRSRASIYKEMRGRGAPMCPTEEQARHYSTNTTMKHVSEARCRLRSAQIHSAIGFVGQAAVAKELAGVPENRTRQ